MSLSYRRVFAGLVGSCALLAATTLAGKNQISSGQPMAASTTKVAHTATNLHTLPAGLMPIVARTLAERDPSLWRAHTTAIHNLAFHNAAQHLSVTFNRHGLQLRLHDAQRDELGMRLVAVRSGHTSYAIAQTQPQSKGNKIMIARGHGLTEWYLNTPLGVEQGFTLAAPLFRDRQLILTFALHGDLEPNLIGNTVEFRKSASRAVLNYGGLFAYDARQHSLPVKMTVHGHELLLNVDARGAHFPIVVDPLFSNVTALPANVTSIDDVGEFGYSVAISADGDTALIGAPFTVVSGEYEAGAAIVCTQTNGTWSTVQIFNDPADAGQDYFGRSVALSADGNTALIGAYNTTVLNEAGDGAAYVYTRTNGVWSTAPVQTFDDPAANVSDGFGRNLALSGNGVTALITGGNAAYVYIQNNGVWSSNPVQMFNASGIGVGSPVALSSDGNTALIGADSAMVPGQPAETGAVYVYAQSDGIWSATPVQTFYSPAASTDDTFGGSVALSSDGKIALIGDPDVTVSGHFGAGTAYVYTQSNGVWSTVPVQTFDDPAITADDFFGQAVALSEDGSTALIGAYGTTISNKRAGAAYVYTQSNGVWSGTPVATLDDPQDTTGDTFGWSTALSEDGSTALIGAIEADYGVGVTYAYTTTADLSLDLTSNPASVTTGQNVSYLFTAANNDSQVTGTNLSLTDTLPAGMTYVSDNPAGGTCSNASDTVTCTLAALAPEATWQPSITVTATTAGSIQNTASISASQEDPNPSNNTATVTTDVTPLVPVASNGSVSTTERTVVDGALSAIGAGTLTFAIVAQPQDGTVSITDSSTGAFTYTPAPGYAGSDSFTFTASNSNGTSNIATESITVSAAPPVAIGTGLTTMENTPVNGTLSATGIGPLTFAVAANPTHGTATITNTATGAFTYTPASGYSGSDSFTFTANNSGGTSNTATESVTVTPSAPVATNGNVDTRENTAVNGMLSATGSGSLTFAVVTNPTHGTITITDAATGTFTYTPASGYAGPDSFTFTATNSGGTSNTATESITIGAAPPAANNGNVNTTENTTINGTLSATGIGPLTFTVATASAHGTVTITNASTGAFAYSPAAGFVGSDSFIFTASNSGGTSNTATESINVGATPPTAINGSMGTTENTSASGSLSATGTAPLTFSVATNPAHGVVTITNAATGTFTYTPASGYVGPDSFTFVASNSGGTSNVATETITVSQSVPPAAAPIAVNGSVTTITDVAVTGTLAATGTGPLVYAFVTQPENGTVILTNPGSGTFTYTPNTGFTGTDTFSFTASNSSGTSNTATESVTVNLLAPTASNGNVSTTEGTAVNGTLSASGTGPLTFTVTTDPAHGSVNITNAATGTFIYTPVSGYTGSDSFTFTASNSGGTSSPAQETVTVNAANGSSGGGGSSGSSGSASGSGSKGGGGSLGILSLVILVGLVFRSRLLRLTWKII